MPKRDQDTSLADERQLRMQAERALRDSEERFRSVFESAAAGMFISAPAGKFQRVNDALCHMLGYSKDELLEKTSSDITLPVDAERGRDSTHEMLTGANQGFSMETRYVRRDGSVVWAAVTLSPLRDAAGTVCCLGHVVDISDQKRAEAERAVLTEKLHAAQKLEALGELAGGVAHDINNVLTMISVHASLMRGEVESHFGCREDVEGILTACKRGHDLTRNLLGFARQGRYQPSRISLNNSVEEIQSILTRTIPKGISVSAKLDAELAEVVGDPGQMLHVLMNLSLNATDAMATAGELRFETCNVRLGDADCVAGDIPAGEYVRLTVSDTGTGMSAETARRAFEPFFTTKSRGEGTGLGLPMVYGTITNHGGRVSLKSELGAGTTVTIHLPAAQGSPQPPEEQPASAEVRGTGTVLLVEDEPMIRSAGKKLLERLGYGVLTASNGDVALQIYRDHADEIVLVLLDLAMPVMDGAETFRKLQQMNTDVLVLIASGYFKDSGVEELLANGAAGFVQKPFTLESLSADVAAALRSRGTVGGRD